MPSTTRSRHYRRRDPVARAAFPAAASEGAAHQKAMKVENQYLALVQARVRAGQRAQLARMRVRVAAVERELAPAHGQVVDELRDVQRADEVGDAARFAFALDALSATAENRLLLACYAEIRELEELCQVLEAKKASR